MDTVTMEQMNGDEIINILSDIIKTNEENGGDDNE